MRLRRDANGNYSYQFVADESAVSSAQQEYSDAINDLYNFDLDNITNNQEQIVEVIQEYEEKIKEIAEDASLDAETRQQRIAELTDYYGTFITQLT
jgi:vacuolar-type H+-ATPase subunit E/Vma4